ncbi:MAG: bifunctional UDP-N-acetylglucosamine diphosphorylase/glucosamine-1-phosphate N-acetyltransferase GlmU [Marivibrio sp.]|uniref:bifunctional UDP-N-acetylglucosamine diphosphorylase/glucosamine-1-phosphate N-acetyltransferase GlmU n=1 Tax=Marivibrio sp. TaxID=2039719 RepID=UPI0032EF4CF7
MSDPVKFDPAALSEPVAAVLLGAGLGTRMKSDRPKVLQPLAGRPMILYVLDAVAPLEAERRVVVVGPEMAESVGAAVAPAEIAVQRERLGTADAVKAAREALRDFGRGTLFVLFGDTPFIRPETLADMAATREGGAAVVVLGFEAEDPTGYGRLITDETGALIRIVEHRDASEAERAVRLCNSGVMALDAARAWALIERIDNQNAKGEYYLTDVVGLARAEGLSCAAIRASEDELLGVDSKVDLADAEARWQRARRLHAMAEEGAVLSDPASVWFSWDTILDRDVTVGQNVVFGPGVRVEAGASIKPFSHLEGCVVKAGAEVGPYARLRPGADIGEGARIGNFVEVKNATLAPGAKANHLTYLGDAAVGEGANIGAGTITCNYDGYLKHRTIIGPKAFIGSNTALVAPVEIGAGAVVGAGSTVTQDVPADALTVARGAQTTVAGGGKRLAERKSAEKAARKKGE